jgi:hypothetical protein
MVLGKQKQDVTFLKKSNQKTFVYGRRWRGRCHSPQDQKFFASFFQKKALPGSNI